MADVRLYGQADYYYAVSKEILSGLLAKGLISSEQYDKIDELNKKKIYERYLSIADLELGHTAPIISERTENQVYDPAASDEQRIARCG